MTTGIVKSARISKAIGWLIVLICLALAVAAAWRGFRSIPATFSYGLQAEFAELPADDAALEAWLKAQPGVIDRLVHVKRTGNAVGVIWMMTQTVGGEPPAPDLLAAFERLGYRGRVRVDGDYRGD